MTIDRGHRLTAIAVASLVLLVLLAGCAGGTGSPSPPPTTAISAPSATSAATSPSIGESASPTASPSASASPSGATGTIDPANFVAVVDNPWFPLTPGTTLTYKGLEGGDPAVDVVTVTRATRVIAGVTCVVVQDNLKHSGVLTETTKDYYAQDRDGNVWYFGEDTAELNKRGKVTSREGSWLSGVDGASAGIFMEATPTIGKELQQEHYTGHAEDMFAVINLTASVTVPFGAFKDALETKEWTPLEPDVLDHKFYARGVGEVREVTVKGGNDDLSLVSVTSH
jgi:hypothetical protein